MKTIVYNGLGGIQNDLKKFAYRLTQDDERAKDLVQETNLKALEKADMYVSDNSLKSWCYVIMKHTFINEGRKVVREFIDHTENGFYINMSQKTEAEIIEDRFDLKQVMRAKDLLDEKYRKPLEMYISGFKYKEISEKENIPIGTIKSRLAYGRNLIKNYLKL